MSKNDGGPAYPRQKANVGDDFLAPVNGMSLRQFYKAAALQGLCTRMSEARFDLLQNGIQGGMNESRVAGTLADAMLQEDAEFAAKGDHE